MKRRWMQTADGARRISNAENIDPRSQWNLEDKLGSRCQGSRYIELFSY